MDQAARNLAEAEAAGDYGREAAAVGQGALAAMPMGTRVRLSRFDELLDLARDTRSARAATGFRAIELAGDKRAEPQARIVSGLATVATSVRALRPRR